ncbi:MAG: hypothetical protein ACQESN_05710 [Thermotogota bacterium]
MILKIKDILSHFEEQTENVVKIEDKNPLIKNYIFTDEVIRNFEELAIALNSNKTGINIYGKYGTGKSHFINILNYINKNQKSKNIPKKLHNIYSNLQIINIDLSLHTNFNSLTEILNNKILKGETKKSTDEILKQINNKFSNKKVVIVFDEIESFSKIKNISLEIQGLIHSSEVVTKTINFIFITQNSIKNIDNLKLIRNRISYYISFNDYNIKEVLSKRVLKKKDPNEIEKFYEENSENIIFKTPDIKTKMNYNLNNDVENKLLFQKYHPIQPYLLDLIINILNNNNDLSNRTLIYTIHKIIKDKYLDQPIYKWVTLSDLFDILYKETNENNLYKIIYLLEKFYYKDYGVPINILNKFMYTSINEKIESVNEKTKKQLKELKENKKIFIINKHARISSEQIMNIQKYIEKQSKNSEFLFPVELIEDFLISHKKHLNIFNISFNHINLINKNKDYNLDIFYSENEIKLRRQALKNKNSIYLLLAESNEIEEYTKKLYAIKNIDINDRNDKIIKFLENLEKELKEQISKEIRNIFSNSKIIHSKNKPKEIKKFPNDFLSYIKEKIKTTKSKKIYISKNEINKYNIFIENLSFELNHFPEIYEIIKNIKLKKIEKDSLTTEELEKHNKNFEKFKKIFEKLWQEKFNERIVLSPYQSNYKNISLHDLI